VNTQRGEASGFHAEPMPKNVAAGAARDLTEPEPDLHDEAPDNLMRLQRFVGNDLLGDTMENVGRDFGPFDERAETAMAAATGGLGIGKLAGDAAEGISSGPGGLARGAGSAGRGAGRGIDGMIGGPGVGVGDLAGDAAEGLGAKSGGAGEHAWPRVGGAVRGVGDAAATGTGAVRDTPKGVRNEIHGAAKTIGGGLGGDKLDAKATDTLGVSADAKLGDQLAQKMGDKAGGRTGPLGGPQPAARAGAKGGAKGGANGSVKGAANAGKAGGGAEPNAAPGGAGGVGAQGDLTTVNEELAIHQEWAATPGAVAARGGAATSEVGAAGSDERAAFLADAAGGGLLKGFGEGFETGFLMGVGLGLLEHCVPIPGLGLIIGGGLALHGIVSNWDTTSATIGAMGTGASIYEELANDLAGIAAIIDLVINILNVIGGIAGAIALVMWIISVATLGAASPIAAAITAITGGVLMGAGIFNAVAQSVLQPCVAMFRAMHAFTSQASPAEVSVQGTKISAATAIMGGQIGGLAGALAGGAVAKEAGRGMPRAFEPPPLPGPKGGSTPAVEATPPKTVDPSANIVEGSSPVAKAVEAPSPFAKTVEAPPPGGGGPDGGGPGGGGPAGPAGPGELPLATSDNIYELPGKNPTTGEGLQNVKVYGRGDPAKIMHHDNMKFGGINDVTVTDATGQKTVVVPGKGPLEVRTHGPNPAPKGTFSHDNYTTQINEGKAYLDPVAGKFGAPNEPAHMKAGGDYGPGGAKGPPGDYTLETQQMAKDPFTGKEYPAHQTYGRKGDTLPEGMADDLDVILDESRYGPKPGGGGAPPPALPPPPAPAGGPAGPAGPAGTAGPVAPMDGAPVIEPVLPNYKNPPGTPQQIEALQKEISFLQGEKSQAKVAESKASTLHAEHQKFAGDVEKTSEVTASAIAATQAHQAKVGEKEANNAEQTAKQGESSALIKSYPERAAGIATLRRPLAAFSSFTHYASMLPGDIGVKFHQLNAEATNFEKSLIRLTVQMAAQAAAGPAQSLGLQQDKAQLTVTKAESEASGKLFEKQHAETDVLKAANDKKTELHAAQQAKAAEHQAKADAQIKTKQNKADGLAGQLNAWAAEHAAERQRAVEATKAKYAALGYAVTMRE
jgi:hypothetical protein